MRVVVTEVIFTSLEIELKIFLNMRRLTITLTFLAIASIAVAQDQQMEGKRKLTSSRPPVYPAIARSMNLVGTVKLKVTVSTSGAAKSSEVLGGNPLFLKAAQDAVATWKWAPAPEETQVLVSVGFRPSQ